MKNMIKLLAITVALAACGDNKGLPDAHPRPDGPPADAQCSNCPAAPTLGTQIDRMGRPAVNTLLNRAFEPPTAGQGTAKDAYNADATASGWVTAYAPEFMKGLGMIDSLDTGFCGNGICELGETGTDIPATACAADCAAAETGTIATACANQTLYNGGQGSTPMTTSYQTLASILASDELYLDTTKTICAFYLAVEFGVATGNHTTCGGRAPEYDVVDFSLSALAIGINGFSTDGMFTPKFSDGAPKHTDYLSAFPYLGEPHP
ncbi:MAG TPA: DUF4331 family protein [Kofleriaceae bacterium]|nr:DUF4331 family protein [Kofleriaceae bacterium]